jgi:hypothetical protein
MHARHHHAEAIGADQPHAVFARDAFGSVCHRIRAMAQPRCDDERASSATFSRLVDDTGHGHCWRCNHHQLRHERQFIETRDGDKAVDLGMTRIHHAEFSGKACLADIVENGPADGSLPRARANQRDGSRQQQIFSNDRSTLVSVPVLEPLAGQGKFQPNGATL